MVSLIVAMAHNRVIGSKNDLPWYLPADLKHFKELSTGHTVIMGRKTFDSIMGRLGKPLPNRQNIVLTHKVVPIEGAVVVGSFDEALAAATSEEVFVIGGAQVYNLALLRVARMYITEVDADISGDAVFPQYSADEWREISREAHLADDKNQFPYSFVVLERV